jgi:hypothetical protein
MTNEYPIRFTLNDDTKVIVKKVTNNTYDFELLLANKSRKTFIWSDEFVEFADRKGNFDTLVSEAVKKFKAIYSI